MLGHEKAVHALTHVIVAPVHAVQIDHHGPPFLIKHVAGIVADFVEAFDELALERVIEARPYAVVAAHAQHEALVLGEGQVLKELGVKILVAVFGLGAHLKGLLRHIQTILALKAEFAVLIDEGISLLVVELHMPGTRLLADRAIERIFAGGELEGQLARLLVQLAANGQHAVLLVPQLIRVGDQADDREGVIEVHQVGGGRGFAGLQRSAGVEGAGAQHRHLVKGERLAFVSDAGFLRGNGGIQGVIDHGALRHIDGHFDFAFIFAAGQRQRGVLGIAIVPRAIFRAGRGNVVVIKAAKAKGAAIAVVGRNQAERNPVQNASRRVTKADGFAACARDRKIGVKIGHGGQFRLTVQIDDLILPRRNGSPLRELPFARAADAVAQTVAAEVYGLIRRVIKLHIIGSGRSRAQADGIVGGHDFADDDAGGIVGAHHLVAARLSLCVVGLAGRAELKQLPFSRVAASVGIVLRHVFNADAVHQTAVAVAEHDALTLGGDGEVGMGYAVLLQLVLAGAVHQIVAVRRYGRTVRETPLGGLVFLVAQVISGQRDGAVGVVLQLHPVHNLAVLVGNTHLGIGTYLVDDQRAALHGIGRAVLDKAFLRVFIAGTVVGGGFVMAHAVLIDAGEGIAGIRRQRRRGQLVDEVHVGIIEVEMIPRRGDFELAMERLGRVQLVTVAGKHNHPFPCLERIAGKWEGDAVGAVGNHHAFHVQVRAGAVVQLQPVAELAVFIRYGAVVGGHHLADNQAVKAASPDPPASLFGADEIDHNQQRRKQ